MARIADAAVYDHRAIEKPALIGFNPLVSQTQFGERRFPETPFLMTKSAATDYWP